MSSSRSQSPAPSLASSAAPPNAQGEAMSAAQLLGGGGGGEGGGGVAASAPAGGSNFFDHPVWRAARGAGRGRGRQSARGGWSGGSEAGEFAGTARYERISLADLEKRNHEGMVDAESALDSDEEEEQKRKAQGGSKRARQEDDEENEPQSSSDEEQDEEAAKREREEKRQKLAGLMGAAAFGGAGSSAWNDEASDVLSESERSSKLRKKAKKAAFPCFGIECVGCALNSRLGPVNKFVKENISTVTEEALWKLAALVYKRDVQGPVEAEGAKAPAWSWKQVATHYELHTTSNLVARHTLLRQLQLMRATQEQKLMRIEGSERELDKGACELMLKIAQAESRERQLLEQAQGKSRM